MSELIKNFKNVKNNIPKQVNLIAVSKTKPISDILELYNNGQIDFGENKVQEIVNKYESLPKNINWHFIGHLQTNKVKYIAPFIHLIHSVDSFKLLKEINKEAKKNNRIINCLLQIYIATEETKFGMEINEAKSLLENEDIINLNNINIVGLMGMASNISDKEQIKAEFTRLYNNFQEIKSLYFPFNNEFKFISMGMSSDYEIAIECGSNMLRLGSTIFGNR